MAGNANDALDTINGILLRAQNVPDATDRDVHVFMMTRHEQLFRTFGASEGVRWADYSGEPKYRAYKEHVTGDLTLMRWRGGPREDTLFRSVTRENSPGSLFRRTGNTWTFGTRLPYADSLRDGGTGPFGERFPGRLPVALGLKSRARLADLIGSVIRGNTPPAAAWRQ